MLDHLSALQELAWEHFKECDAEMLAAKAEMEEAKKHYQELRKKFFDVQYEQNRAANYYFTLSGESTKTRKEREENELA